MIPGRRRGAAAATVTFGCWIFSRAALAAGYRTKSASIATPRIAKTKLTTKTELKPCGTSTRRPNASSGPIIAPVVSSARWNSEGSAQSLRSVLNEIRASRGAVRIPLPVRSRKIDCRERAPDTAESDQQGTAQGRQSITRERDLLVPPCSVGDRSRSRLAPARLRPDKCRRRRRTGAASDRRCRRGTAGAPSPPSRTRYP